ncbi:hypothetical protein [Lentibacillus sp. Marseille-P4043]|uniref:hypothetical protein n=1 Tax=Lentibacillus sp. Marseille-P4043 TaxID=2040293 RepID=UPI00131A4A2B|nr:hypothetical protein [Lentibacillus sp. Marseille-P4043]
MVEPKRENIDLKHRRETRNINPKRETSTQEWEHRRETRNIGPKRENIDPRTRTSTRNAKHQPVRENISPIKSPAESNSIVTSQFMSIVSDTTNVFDGASNRSPNLLENNFFI